jgi:hypothetical protein
VQVAPENAEAWLHLAFAIEPCGGLTEAESALREAVVKPATLSHGPYVNPPVIADFGETTVR